MLFLANLRHDFSAAGFKTGHLLRIRMVVGECAGEFAKNSNVLVELAEFFSFH